MPPPSKRDSGKNKDVTARTADANGDFSATCRRLLLPLPTSRVGIPKAVGEQAIQIGKVCIAVDEEAQAFAIFLARPLAVPRLPPRIVGVEVQAAERLPAAMVAAFDVAARAMAFAARRAAIRAWSELLAHACCQIYASVESGARLRREFGV